jgi:hypothetical protein
MKTLEGRLDSSAAAHGHLCSGKVVRDLTWSNMYWVPSRTNEVLIKC